MRDDVLFVYDLEVPADFEPKNRDGEFSGFTLMPAAAVLERIRTSSDFKFNVNLVILDFAVRHGILRPDDPGISRGSDRPAPPPRLNPCRYPLNSAGQVTDQGKAVAAAGAAIACVVDE